MLLIICQHNISHPIRQKYFFRWIVIAYATDIKSFVSVSLRINESRSVFELIISLQWICNLHRYFPVITKQLGILVDIKEFSVFQRIKNSDICRNFCFVFLIFFFFFGQLLIFTPVESGRSRRNIIVFHIIEIFSIRWKLHYGIAQPVQPIVCNGYGMSQFFFRENFITVPI